MSTDASADNAPVLTGIDAPAVTDWFEATTEIARPLHFELIAGGNSNLTYKVTDSAGRAFALRRPPTGHVLATAHDMAREHRILQAVAQTSVAVPAVVGLCEDPEVNGAPFYVMQFAPGTVVRSTEIAETYPVETRASMSRHLVETLAALHAVNPDNIGLGDLGRKDEYISRQLRRWSTQYEQSRTHDRPLITEVHDILARRIPDQGPAGIVHGDYRLDNCMVAHDGRITAVLDWELCTLGDTMADLGGLWMYWSRPSDERTFLPSAPTMADGMPQRDTLMAWYAEASGRDLSNLPYYIAFAHWRGACILQGVYNRFVNGAMGDKDASGSDYFRQQVEWLAERARAATTDLG